MRLLTFTGKLFLMICATLLLVELSVRILSLAPSPGAHSVLFVPDELIPFKPRPNSTVKGGARSKEFDFVLRHNSLGFRDVEHEQNKPSDTFRIIGLGDSHAYGLGASYEDTIFTQLEKMFSQRKGEHPSVEIIKAGIPRYFPAAELLVLKHYGLTFQPDLVLLTLVPGDVGDTFLGLDAVQSSKNGYLVSKEAKILGALGEKLYLHSHTFRIVWNASIQKWIRFGHAVNTEEIYQPNGAHEKDWQQLEKDLLKIAQTTNHNNATFVIVYIPHIGPWNEKSSYPADRISKWCQNNQVTFINSLPALKQAAESKDVFWRIDRHPNPRGYRIIAETVFKELTKKQLVP